MCVCVCVHVYIGGYGSEGSDFVLSAQEEKGMPKSRTLEQDGCWRQKPEDRKTTEKH